MNNCFPIKVKVGSCSQVLNGNGLEGYIGAVGQVGSRSDVLCPFLREKRPFRVL